MSSIDHSSVLLKGKLTNDPRYGEAGPAPGRSKRFHFDGNAWMCQMRKDQYLGPFSNFKEAEKALVLYLRRCGVVKYVAET